MTKTQPSGTNCAAGGRALVLVLGDQLSLSLSSLRAADPNSDVVLMCEVHEEATYVRHHKKKLAFVFSAMRHFAEELRAAGWTIDYRTLDQTGPAGSFTSEVEAAIARHKPTRIVVTSPGEWRVRDAFAQWNARFGLPVEILDDDRFISTVADFASWAEGRHRRPGSIRSHRCALQRSA